MLLGPQRSTRSKTSMLQGGSIRCLLASTSARDSPGLHWSPPNLLLISPHPILPHPTLPKQPRLPPRPHQPRQLHIYPLLALTPCPPPRPRLNRQLHFPSLPHPLNSLPAQSPRNALSLSRCSSLGLHIRGVVQMLRVQFCRGEKLVLDHAPDFVFRAHEFH